MLVLCEVEWRVKKEREEEGREEASASGSRFHAHSFLSCSKYIDLCIECPIWGKLTLLNSIVAVAAVSWHKLASLSAYRCSM